MCGITGIATFRGNAPPPAEVIRAMCRTLVHRGPDDEGIHLAGGVGLGARRLAVMDPAGGRQPMVNARGTTAASLNGEIYNFRELRRELEGRGRSFLTRCDTEVVLQAYDEYGSTFVDRLNGMFAIVIHDIARRRLILVRDHMGIKPLYYAFGDDCVVWGSEVKAVLASGLVKRELDADALGQFMSWEYVPGSRTLIRSVARLGPGELLEVDLETGRRDLRSYWEIPVGSEQPGRSPAQWEEEVDATLAACVRRQLASDVPLGVFLSGGVDSSLVVAAMAGARSFSIGFEDASYDELPYAQAVARHLGTRHTCERLEADVVDLFDPLMESLDDPIGDFSIFPTFLVSRLAREHVTVALSGDGGDELFGGYESYVANELAQTYARIPGWIREKLLEPPLDRMRPRGAKKGLVNKAKRFVEGCRHAPSLEHARWRLFAGEAMRAELFTPDALAAMPTPVGEHVERLLQIAGGSDRVNRCLYTDARSYLCDNILTKVDRMSMAASLEARVPLLDKDLVTLAFRIPGALKVRGRETKVLLKRVAARHIPRECVYRPKEGFSIPIKNWLGGRLRPLMESLLSRASIDDEGLFNWSAVARLKAEHLAGTANHSHVLWSLMVYRSWKQRWLSESAAPGQSAEPPAVSV